MGFCPILHLFLSDLLCPITPYQGQVTGRLYLIDVQIFQGFSIEVEIFVDLNLKGLESKQGWFFFFFFPVDLRQGITGSSTM